MFQEREVFTMHVQDTRKKLDGLRNLHKMDQTAESRFLAQNRKVAFIIDNCPAHPHVPNLAAVDLIFLPPNTTSVTQTMDQGVIRSFKAKYEQK